MRSPSPRGGLAEAIRPEIDAAAEASAHLSRGEIAEAVERIERARAREPGNPRIRFLLAFAAWRLFDLVGGIRILTELVDEAPRNGTFAEALATMKAMVGDLDEALFLGKLATALPPDSDLQALIPPDFPTFGDAFLSISERPLVRTATGLEHQGRTREAVRSLEQHVRLFPADRDSAATLSRLLLTSGREEEAVQHIGPLVGGDDAVSLSLLARASAAVGDAGGARGLHAHAVAADAGNLAAAAAAARDAFWYEPNPALRHAAVESWLDRFASGPRSARPFAPRPEKLRIGYLVAGAAGSPVGAAVAAVARRHDGDRVEARGYGYGELASDANIGLRGGFDDWRDVSRIDPPTLARIMEGDALDLVIDASGLRHPESLVALSIAHVPLRCGWLGLAEAVANAPYDRILTCQGAPPGPVPGHGLGPSHLAAAGKPVDRPAPQPGILRLGLDLKPREATPGFLIWLRELCTKVPTLQIVVFDHGFSQPIVVDRLIAQLGDAAGRVDLVKAAEPRAFLAQIDLMLCPSTSELPRAAAEALGHGVPVVVEGGTAAPAILRNAGLPELVASDQRAAIHLIGQLAGDGAALDSAWARAAAAAASTMFDGRRIAGEIEALAAQVEPRHGAR